MIKSSNNSNATNERLTQAFEFVTNCAPENQERYSYDADISIVKSFLDSECENIIRAQSAVCNGCYRFLLKEFQGVPVELLDICSELAIKTMASGDTIFSSQGYQLASILADRMVLQGVDLKSTKLYEFLAKISPSPGSEAFEIQQEVLGLT